MITNFRNYFLIYYFTFRNENFKKIQFKNDEVSMQAMFRLSFSTENRLLHHTKKSKCFLFDFLTLTFSEKSQDSNNNRKIKKFLGSVINVIFFSFVTIKRTQPNFPPEY